MSDSNSPYDLLFTTGRGKVEKYTKVKHGLWEIYLTESQQLAVREVKDELIKHIYTPCDIIWIKNVTSKTTDSAYLYIDEPIFVLHFPNVHYPNIMTPKIGELILIYQKVGGIPSFTHIVTPIDYIPIEDIQRSDYRYGRRVKIIAKTNRDNIIHVSSTSWKRIKFGGFTQGNACKIENIKNVGNIDELQYDLWQRFSNYFSRDEQQSVFSTSALLNEIQVSHPGMSVREGQLRLVKHLLKERNRKIIAEKKAEAIRNGSLLCEVCEFSFKEVFNKEFIECHHLTPIGKPGVRDTTLDDLALVCANCHRMLHTKFENKYLTLEELRKRKDRPKAHP
jgi:5-methylcytosine-specific restriction endonuclease McrA